MSAILRDDPEAAIGIRAGLPELLAQTIDRCLKKNPNERPQTAREVAAELRRIDQERMTPATAAGPEWMAEWMAEGQVCGWPRVRSVNL
ncbi:MAG: hypothetical protein ACREJ6_11745 [Candidatus Methylomirabilis sp.]